MGPSQFIRRGIRVDITAAGGAGGLPQDDIRILEKADLVYRTLCAVLFNFVPSSGHPGGSISSGRIVQNLLWNILDYDFSSPDEPGADVICYGAGHKAMGLYSAWALRDELTRIGNPKLLAPEKRRVRFEDLLGFRRNPTNRTPLYKKFNSKPLDGHPTPATPFVPLATGASGVGVATSFGLAMGIMDIYRDNPPKVHVLEGEGGLTPGRVHEAMATAASAQLHNIVLHIDWNQASIDSNHVCRDGDKPGDYVQWNPAELARFHDWNVVMVNEGMNFAHIAQAQQLAKKGFGRQPTAVVYRTTKGWKYGIEGRASHGAGHAFCSPEYHKFMGEFEAGFGVKFPRFSGEKTPDNVEKNFWETLSTIRSVLEKNREIPEKIAGGIEQSRQRLHALNRAPRKNHPNLSAIYDKKKISSKQVPEALILKPGSSTTLRAALGDVLGHLNKETGGAFFGAAADLMGSTSLSNLGKGFPPGFYNSVSNPDSRLMAVGGICEDAMGGVLAGLATYGYHIGAGSSYGAFIAALQHIAARLHCIGQQARASVTKEPFKTFIMICAHAGIKTGEDGPTHADPQPLQLLQENFPKGMLITLTPWDPAEMWPLVIAGLQSRPGVLAPFVTRPSETILDRQALKLAPATDTIKGIYRLRPGSGKTNGRKSSKTDGTIILQGSEVAYAFITEALPELDKKGVNLNIFYVSSAELFDLLPASEQEKIYPVELAREAIGITGFTLPTMDKWLLSKEGRARTLHPFKNAHYLGSGQAHKVLEEGGLHGEGQVKSIMEYIGARKKKSWA